MPSIRSNTKWKCKVCGSIFDFADVTHVEPCTQCGSMKYRGITVVTVCDFCGTADSPRWWCFPCKDVAYLALSETPELLSGGSWIACQCCYELIEADDRAGLAKRSVEGANAIYEMNANRHIQIAEARQMHNKFFENRNGEAYETEPGQS